MLNIVSVLIQNNLDISNVHAIHFRAGLKIKRDRFERYHLVDNSILKKSNIFLPSNCTKKCAHAHFFVQFSKVIL